MGAAARQLERDPRGEVHPGGFFEAILGPVGIDFRYRLRVQGPGEAVWETEDAYRFGRVLSDYDLYLLGEGKHHENYEKLGAHLLEIDGVRGVHFAVWAPNAERVSVVGTFNDWDGRRNPMRNVGQDAGIWEILISGAHRGRSSTSSRSAPRSGARSG